MSAICSPALERRRRGIVASPEQGADDFLAGFIDDYYAECDEHLTTIRRLLADANPAASRGMPAGTIEELFRAFHSIKGLSGMVELRDAELLAHHLESYLRQLRARETILSSQGLDALIGGTSLLERVVAARREGTSSPVIAPAIEALAIVSVPDMTGGPGTERDTSIEQPLGTAWSVVFTPSAALAARGVTVDRVRTRLTEIGRITDAAPRVDDAGGITFEFVVESVQDASAFESWADDGIVSTQRAAHTPEIAGQAAEPATGGSALTSSHFVRVDLGRLDELMRMIGDLVITRARLGESLAKIEARVPAVEWRTVQENSHSMERQLRDLREGVMRVRLVRVGEIFERMPFVVRDLARESGRGVELQITGQETEIDKYLVERMMDPVLHLVRNAVSHGIEPAAARRASGKDETGLLTLSAASVGDLVTIEVADDGRGVDIDAVRKRARAIGIAVDDGPLEGRELLDILCAPGFSTRDTADRAAGRGVGMAVVRSAVQELGGVLTLDTVRGQGTRFLIELPLTLAITDAIIASVGGQIFAVPQSSVREVIDVAAESVRALENHEIMPYRGGVLPLLRLASVFGLVARPGRTLHVFVIGSGASAVGVAVDRIHTQREIVVRTMTDPLIRSEGITGATDLGDGRVVLILDLLRTARLTSESAAQALRSGA
jgi:two-component system, chemotaxis family, sensor kinase CheA